MKVREESTSKSFMILTAATFLMKVMSLVFVPVLLYLIGAEAHGIYTTAYEYFSFIYVVTNEGLTKGIARMVSERMARDDIGGAHKVFRIARRILGGIGLVSGVIFYFLAEPLANVAEAPASLEAMQILGGAIFLTSISSAYRGYFQGRRQLSVTAKSQIWEQVVHVILSLIFAAVLIPLGMNYGVAGAASGTLFGALISVIYLMVIYRRTGRAEPGERRKSGMDRGIARTLLDFTIPLTVGTAATQFGNVIDLINVKSRLIVSGLTEAGANITYSHLSSYKTMIAVPLTVVTALSTSIFPSLARAAALGDQAEVRRIYEMSLKICYLIVLPSAAGLFAVAGPANQAIYDGNPQRGLLIAMGSFVVIFSGLTGIQIVLLQAQGLQRITLIPLLTGIAVKIAANYVLVAMPTLQGQGAIIGSYAQGIVTVLLNEYFIRSRMSLKADHWRFIAKPALGALGMGLLLVGTRVLLPEAQGRLANGMLLLILVILGVISYSFILIFSRGLGREDFNAVRPGLADRLPGFIRKRLY